MPRKSPGQSLLMLGLADNVFVEKPCFKRSYAESSDVSGWPARAMILLNGYE